MERTVFITADGSSSVKLQEWNEQYHSKYGAIQEANHVYLQSGLVYFLDNFEVRNELLILEIGFGTGLNALLTALYAENKDLLINYVGLEAYPVDKEIWEKLNYPDLIKENRAQKVFENIHQTSWNERIEISSNFHLQKKKQRFEDFKEVDRYDLIYFDAFGPQVQPELWSESIFEAMFKSLRNKGILLTYSVKGSVKRNLRAVGFTIEKIPGPPGKREILRAIKNS